jgi:3-(3-hydroxy-phenyl)propionate hydroxylase
VPIFGVRGANSGIDDADNLAWKLAWVVQGRATDTLLDSYSDERVFATHENLSYGTKSTEFMAPPSFAFDLMRTAVLSLARKHPSVRSLINPRQTSAITYVASPLNAATSTPFANGPVPGAVLPECPLTLIGAGTSREGHLTALVAPRFTALWFSTEGSVPAELAALENTLAARNVPFSVVPLAARQPADATRTGGWDHTGRLFPMYGVETNALYLVRPDGHVLGRWQGPADALAAHALTAIDHTLRA